MQKYLFGLSLLLSCHSFGQNLEVLSHYPESGYITNRLLPFKVEGLSNIKLLKVNITTGPSCSSIIDPYYMDTFHVYCHRPELFDLQVLVSKGGGEVQSLIIKNVSVVKQRAPLPEPDEVVRTPDEGGG